MKAYTEGDFTFRTLTLEDKAVVNRMVKELYLPNAPRLAIFKVKPSEVGDYYEERVEDTLKDNTSAGCFHTATGELACLALCKVLVKETQKSLVKNRRIGDYSEVAQIWFRFGAAMKEGLFETLNARRIYNELIAIVHPKFAKLGLFTELDLFTNRLAVELDCDCIVADAMSLYAQRVAVKHGYEVLREIRYSEYVDAKTGRKPDLKLSPLHVKAQIAYLRIQTTQKSSL